MKDEQIEERDILLLYISDQFKELFGIDSENLEGTPLESAYVDELLEGFTATKDPAVVHKLLFDHLNQVWSGQKSGEDLHRLVGRHYARMASLVHNAKTISRQAQKKVGTDPAANMMEIRMISEKRDIIRGYVGQSSSSMT